MRRSAVRIIHYFSPMSGFAYLGMGALCSLAAARKVDVSHRPIDIRRVFAAVEAVAPAAQSSARLEWRRTDMGRWAKRRGLPLNVKPRHWPINADLASCAIIAAQQAGLAVNPVSGSELQKIVGEIIGAPEPVKKRLAGILAVSERPR